MYLCILQFVKILMLKKYLLFQLKSVIYFCMLAFYLLISNSVNAQCPTTPAGNQVTFGAGSWIGYVYANLVSSANPPTDSFTSTYRGFVTRSESFDQNLGTGSLTDGDVNLCGSYNENFGVRYKLIKNYTAGNYNIIVGADDGYRLYINGVLNNSLSNFSDHGYSTSTAVVALSGTTELILEYYEKGGDSRISFDIVLPCTTTTTAPTSITGTTTICAGSSTTLTAVGGIGDMGSFFEWGTGGTIGQNIISGATAATITVSPSNNTIYWVRRIDAGRCKITSGVSQLVTVEQVATAPTGISGNTSCLLPNLVLTATGGVGSVYQWGTGSIVGSNIISGATAENLTIASPTNGAAYWVRRTNVAPCVGSTTSGVTTTLSLTAVPGDKTTYGNPDWIGYVYAYSTSQNPPNPPTNVELASGTYLGYTTENLNFDRNLIDAGPSGVNLCRTINDFFYINYRLRKTVTAGYYNVAVGGDDGYRFSTDGGATYVLVNNWTDSPYTSINNTIYLAAGTYDFVLDYYEKQGQSQVSFNFSNGCTPVSTAPTSISGSSTICNGSNVTLTAVGGATVNGATYQWGTGATIGLNIIAGASFSTVNVSPTGNTTYWVRIMESSPCNNLTAGVSTNITVNNPSTAPTSISGNTICAGFSTTLNANGGSGSNYQWGTGNVPGTNPISGATNATYFVATPVNGAQYWVWRSQSSPCAGNTTALTTTLVVTALSGDQISYGNGTWIGYIYSNQTTFPPADGFNTNYSGFVTQPFTFDQNFGGGAISGVNLCSSYNDAFAARYKMTRTMPNDSYTITVGGDDGFRLSVDGGTTWITNPARWTNQSYVTNSVTVTLSGTINFVIEYFENGGDARLTFDICSTAPTEINGRTAICSGDSTILTAAGGVTGSVVTYEWGTGATIGSNVIAGATSVAISVSPTVNTVYWVRRIGVSPCTTTSGITQMVTVGSTPVGGTVAGSQIVCVNTLPNSNLTLTGSVGDVVRWEKSLDAAFTSPTTIAVTNTTLTGAQIGIISAPTYIRAIVAVCTSVPSTSVLIGFDSTTWNGLSWSNGLPTLLKTVVINANYNTTTQGNLDACGVIVNSGVTLTVTSGNYLTIQNALSVSGTINIQNTGSLVQISNTAVNTGNITMTRTTSTYEKYDYVYWSSPVASTTMLNPFTGWRMDYAFLFNTANFSDRFNGSYPQTTGTPDSFDDNGDDWQNVNNSTVMIPGKGYIVMTPTTGSFPTTANVNFTGVPTNGIVNIPMALSANNSDANDDFNLIGNPYPSAISAASCINANLPNISGTIYFWTHIGNISPINAGPNSNNYNSDDYALFNLSGATRTALTVGANEMD